jgi:membrane associated rhomboid family serine protease
MVVIAQRRTPPITAALIALTLGMSIVVAIDARRGGELYHHLALLPQAVWHGQVWRLMTWPFIQGSPLSLIFACVALYAFGSDLLLTWGAARYLRYLAGIVLIAGSYFVLLLRGPALVAVIVAVTVLFALFYGITWVLPELLAIAAALLYMSRSRRRWWLKLRLTIVRRRLGVVRGDRADR